MPKGNGHKDALHFSQPPRRVVSLVPWMTESLLDLGIAGSLVGITNRCSHPEIERYSIARIGDPADFLVEAICDLKPDLVLADWEENTLDGVNKLRNAGLAVWVTLPRTVRESVDILWTLANLYRSQIARLRIQTLEVTLDWAISACDARTPFRYFCPIWFDRTEQGVPWWVTFNQDTYSSDLLELFGGCNVFELRERRQPLEADLGIQEPSEIIVENFEKRYPRIGAQEILAAAPELILLPSEPYAFSDEDLSVIRNVLVETPAVKNGRVHFVDGRLITWRGTCLARSLRELPALLDSFIGI